MSNEPKTETTLVGGRVVQVTATPEPAPAPAKGYGWQTIGIAILLMIFGGIGAYTQYVGPIHWPTPVPIPGPGPAPAPLPVPPVNGPPVAPGDLWQPLATPTKNEVPGLKLPAPTEVAAGQKYIQVTAICAKKVHWLVSGRNASTPVEALTSPISNTILILPGGEDTIVVLAYSVDETGQPTDTAVTYLKVGANPDPPPPDPTPEPTPKPKPAPTPAPVVKPSKVHVTFIYEKAKQTRAISDIVNDPALRTWLAPWLVDKVHELDPTKDKLSDYHLDTYVAGKTLPVLVIQTSQEPGIKGGDVVFAGTVTSSQQVKDAVTNVTGGK